MADGMKSPSSEYLNKFLLERSRPMTSAQRARGETAGQRNKRQKQQADRKKNDPKRKKQVANQTANYDKKNPESRKKRDMVATAKEHPNGESAKELKKLGLDVKKKKCSKCGSTKGLQADHVQQNSSAKYTGHERMRWLCNNCHQTKTAQKREEKGQTENQYGKAKNESFEDRLHGSLQALMEAGDEGRKRARRRERSQAKEQEGRRDLPPANTTPANNKRGDVERELEREKQPGYIYNQGRIIRKARKPRKVGGRAILPKYKDRGVPTLYFRKHPQYPVVLQIIDAATDQPTSRDIYNGLFREINNVEYHRSYKLSPESLSKYGLTDTTVTGRELGIEEDTVYEFELRDLDTTLVSRSYSTDMVTYSFKDHEGGTVHQGQILRINDNSDPETPGKVISFRDMSGDRYDIITNEKMSGPQGEFYRYGRPDSQPELVNPFYTIMDDKGKKVKKYLYQKKSSGLGAVPTDDEIEYEDLSAAIERLAPDLAAKEMQNYFWRDAFQRVTDEWSKQRPNEELTADQHDRLARERYMQIVTSEEGKSRIKERAQQLILRPTDDLERRALALVKSEVVPRSRREIPKGMENRLQEDPRPAASIFEVTRDGNWNAKGEYDNPADLNKAVFTLYGVEVVSPNPDHELMRYLINGYRKEADHLSNYQAVIPRLMMAGPPKEIDRSVAILRVKNVAPEEDEDGELQHYRELRIDAQDIVKRVSTETDESYFAEVDRIRQDYKQTVQQTIDAQENPETKSSMQDALNRALKETSRLELEDEAGQPGFESDEEYMDRTNVRKLPLDERTLNSYNFYGEKEENGQTVWPALETNQIRQNVRMGMSKAIRYAIPKSVRVYDTYDMHGNLHKGLLSTAQDGENEWLDKITHSENYDSFGMKKPASELRERQAYSSSGMKFKDSMSPAEFALGIINPYLMKLDPGKQVAYLERSFTNAWADPERQKRMRERAIATMSVQRALDMTGSAGAWYNLNDVERDERTKTARSALEKDLSTGNENVEALVKTQAMETFRIQALTSLNRQMANTEGMCPKCSGSQYLKVLGSTEVTGDLTSAVTGDAMRKAMSSEPIRYERATYQDYEVAKKNPRTRGSVIVCNACGGTGQQLKEKTSMLYAGQQSKAIDHDVFSAAMDEALDFVEDESQPDSKLVSRTMKALFPTRLTELTRTNMPAAQIKPFLSVLAQITDAYLNGEMPVEGSLNPEIVKTGRGQAMVYKVPTPEGERTFMTPVKSANRYLTVQTLVDSYGRMDKVPTPLYIEGKEDQESYILDNIASIAYGGYGELQKASMPEELQDYQAAAAENFNSLPPETRARFLRGNPAEKIKFERMIEKLRDTSDTPQSTDPKTMQSFMRPWATKTILQVVSVSQGKALASMDELSSMLKRADRTEDPEINRDNSFYSVAAAAYRRALLDMDVSEEDFINDMDLCQEYVMRVLTGDTSPMFEEDAEERSVVTLGCRDVSNGQDVVLTYNLDRNPDQRVMRLWEAGKRAKPVEKSYSPEEQAQIQQDMLQDALQRFEEKGRTPMTQLLNSMGAKWKISNGIINRIRNGKIAAAANGLAMIVRKQDDPVRAQQKVINLLKKTGLPDQVVGKIDQTISEVTSGTLGESKFMPILMIAEEIDSEAGSGNSYTPEDIASFLD